jgi:spermidine synthase
MELWFTENHTPNVRFGVKIKEHLISTESDFQKIDIFDTYEFGKMLTIDGLIMVTEKDEFVYHEMIVHVPMASNPNIKRVLVVGGGDGGTVRELTRYPHIEQIDMVEIDQKVVEVCQTFIPQTASKLKDTRVTLYFEDGIQFIKKMDQAYDLIIIDSTDPIGPGEGLFTESFYKDCYAALTEEGIMINQNESPYYEKERRELVRANKKIKNVFPIVSIYQFFMTTYPSGHWLFGFNSKSINPLNNNIDLWNQQGIQTKYYNTDLHKGSFMLPNYVKEMIRDDE